MKHAGPAALSRLNALLAELRARTRLRERTPGCFYLGSKAFLHFHEDPAGLFADVKLDRVEFVRVRVSTEREQRAALAQIDRSLDALH